MNSKQRRQRIRAGMPGVIHRLVVMKLMGDAEANHVDSYLGSLRSPDLKLSGFGRIVRHVAQLERTAEMRRIYAASWAHTHRSVRIVGAHPSLGARYSGSAVKPSPSTKSLLSNDQSLRTSAQVPQTRPHHRHRV